MIGELKVSDSPTTQSKCEGRMGEFAQDGRFFVRGYYNVRLPAGAQQKEAAENLRNQFKKQGYEITEFYVRQDGSTDLQVRNPADDFQISVLATGSDTPWPLALWVTTPCLAPPK